MSEKLQDNFPHENGFQYGSMNPMYELIKYN